MKLVPPNMLRIFLDTEFTELTQEAKLISIGLVDETGEHSFYAELSDTWRLQDLGDFAARAVAPLLDGQAASMSMGELREQLGGWLSGFERPVCLATDSLTWDWRWICELFPWPSAWPGNLNPTPLLLTMNYLHHYDAFELAVQNAFCNGLLPPTEN